MVLNAKAVHWADRYFESKMLGLQTLQLPAGILCKSEDAWKLHKRAWPSISEISTRFQGIERVRDTHSQLMPASEEQLRISIP